jgi:hypothetical protein
MTSDVKYHTVLDMSRVQTITSLLSYVTLAGSLNLYDLQISHL